MTDQLQIIREIFESIDRNKLSLLYCSEIEKITKIQDIMLEIESEGNIDNIRTIKDMFYPIIIDTLDRDYTFIKMVEPIMRSSLITLHAGEVYSKERSVSLSIGYGWILGSVVAPTEEEKTIGRYLSLIDLKGSLILKCNTLLRLEISKIND